MKKEEIKQLNVKPESELTKLAAELKEKLWNLRKDLVAGKVKNIQEIRQAKKDVARILTALNIKKMISVETTKK